MATHVHNAFGQSVSGVFGAACLLTLVACSSTPNTQTNGLATENGTEERPDVRALAENPPPIEFEIRRGEYAAALPETLGTSAPGIETLSWTTRKPPTLFREFLEGLTVDLPPEPDEARSELQRWRASGFDIAVLPIDRLGLLVTGMTPLGSLNHRAWGIVPTWQPLHAPADSPPRLSTAGGPVEVPTGAKPRLLVRSWTEPNVDENGLTDLVRLELIPQLYETPTLEVGQPARLYAPIEQGRALAAQSLTLAMRPGECLLLTASAPSEEPAPGSGPPVPTAPSLATALFAPDAWRVSAGTERTFGEPSDTTLLVIVPVTGIRAGDGR